MCLSCRLLLQEERGLNTALASIMRRQAQRGHWQLRIQSPSDLDTGAPPFIADLTCAEYAH